MLTAISANASLIDPASHGLPLGISLGILSLTIVQSFVMLCILPKKGKLITGAVALVLIPALFMTSTAVRSDRNAAIEATKSNISEALQAKYGVTVLGDFYTIRPQGLTPALSKGPIPAKNVDGKAIEIRIELTLDETDVIAFIASDEMPTLKVQDSVK